jgi:hypothetical protein
MYLKEDKLLKVKVSITLDEDVIAGIKELASKDNRSFSQYINIVLIDHLNRINKNSIIEVNDRKR